MNKPIRTTVVFAQASHEAEKVLAQLPYRT
jgi:hypothetical protein